MKHDIEINELKRRFNAQLTISNELAKATSLKQISQKILMTIATTFGWEMGALWLKNSDGHMDLKAIWPNNSRRATTLKKETNAVVSRLKIKIIETVRKTGIPFWSEKIDKNDFSRRKEIFKNASIKSSFIMPIEDNTKVIGVLEFYSSHKKPKDETTISILDAIKNSIGQVIQKQRMIKEHDSVRRQMQTIFDNVPSGITVESPSGEIINANKAVADIFNIKHESQLVGKNINEIFSKYKIVDVNGVELKFKDRPAQKSLNGMKDVSETLSFINKVTGAKRYLLIRATLVNDLNQRERRIIKSYKDITEAMEEQRQRDFFVGVLSHELKNPVTSIKAYAQLLKRKIINKNSKIFDYAENIESQTNRVDKLMSDIFDMNKFIAGKFFLNKRKIDLDKTVQKIVSSFSLTVKDRVIKQKGRTGLDVVIDEDRFVQVLVNLLSNAVKYSSSKKDIQVILKKYPDFVTISVKDKGIGIPQKYHSEVFKFFRVLPSGSLNKKHGLGMGLAIARSIIKAHDGDILVKSKQKKGSEFIIKLPIFKENII